MGWKIVPHPLYSPDLAPSDFYLFRSMSSALKGKFFNDREEECTWLNEWFFFKTGIFSLITRWECILDSEGKYIID